MMLWLMISVGKAVAPTVAAVATIIDVRRHQSLMVVVALN